MKSSYRSKIDLVLYYNSVYVFVVMLLKRNSYFFAFYAMVNENYRTSFFLKALKILTFS